MNDQASDLRAKLNALVETIAPPPLRAFVSDVFKDLTDLLDYLDLLEACMLSEEMLSKSPLLFKFMNERAQALIKRIDAEGKQTSGVPEAMRSLLDSTVFALNYEMQRVAGLFALNPAQTKEQWQTEVTRAHGILLNCFQQSVISFALVFDRTLTSTKLFDDFRRKLEQSMILVEALTILSDQTEQAEKARDLDAYFALIEGLKMFGQGYMNYLIYSDWAEFEKFSEKIISARSEFDLWPLLHQFARYLETLVSHVKLRAVFQGQLAQQDATVKLA